MSRKVLKMGVEAKSHCNFRVWYPKPSQSVMASAMPGAVS